MEPSANAKGHLAGHLAVPLGRSLGRSLGRPSKTGAWVCQVELPSGIDISLGKSAKWVLLFTWMDSQVEFMYY